MSPQRWLFFILAILIGLGLGLFYGRVISPVEYVDTTLDTLSPDYRADFVLMAAEIYHADHNVEAAARQLARLGSLPPAEIAAQALAYARQIGYHPSDLALIEDLVAALQVWQPPAHSATQPAGSQP